MCKYARLFCALGRIPPTPEIAKTLTFSILTLSFSEISLTFSKITLNLQSPWVFWNLTLSFRKKNLSFFSTLSFLFLHKMPGICVQWNTPVNMVFFGINFQNNFKRALLKTLLKQFQIQNQIFGHCFPNQKPILQKCFYNSKTKTKSPNII